jgi:hypothetical protein
MQSRSLDMQCWKCGYELKGILLPFSRNEECGSCNSDLRSCRACKNYEPNVADACKEDRADFTADKDKANFCDYFDPDPAAFLPQDSADALQAKNQLAELFGEESTAAVTESSPRGGHTDSTEADKALAELKRLFGDENR